MWLYKNPRSADIVSPAILIYSVIFCPLLTTFFYYGMTKNKRDLRAASWTWTLILCLNGLITSLLKISVGRPRPDFYYRCFPDGVLVVNPLYSQPQNGSLEYFSCTGDLKVINEGRKSFPSGHSSCKFSFFTTF